MHYLNFFQRLREPSSWAGVSVLLTLFGVPAGIPEALGQIVTAATAVAAVLLSEGGGKDA